jgi:signal transduction histidine kinase/DNA-binding response OmpR family regulator
MDDSKVNILLVDDKPEKLLSLEAVLEDLDQNVIRAQSGREALRQILSREFAVILLDINMPDMDGFETAQLIRQRRQSAHVPIIFLTAMTDEMHVCRGYSLGAVDYILTPVVPQVLRSKVAVFVDLFKKTQQVQLQADRLRQRATQLHRLTGASLAINSAQSVQKIVQIVTETARELIGTHHAMTLVSSGTHPVHTDSCVSYSEKNSAWRNKVPDIQSRGIYALVSGTNKPLRMTQIEIDAHAPTHSLADDGPPLRGLLAAPLAGRDGRNMGAIFLSDRIDGEFTDDDQAILVQLSQMASVAVENTIFAAEREANRLKDEFLSTLSHELRTPLNAMAGWVQLLRMQTLEEEVSHGLDVIERNVGIQTRLIEDLLDLSRIATGKVRLNSQPVQIVEVVTAAVDALRPIVQEKGIIIDCDFDGAAQATVLGDPDRLQQVFWNLLSNAGKFTPKRGKITVRLARDGDMVRLSVADTGEGIDPEFLPYVFDRFRQADSTSSRRHGGLGIGLAIVQHLLQLHRGSVHAESAGKGRGATFSVTLPTVVTSGQKISGNGLGDSESKTLHSLKSVRVLVVDDEADSREVILQILRRNDAEVEAVPGAAEALKRIASMRPDVVVTDLAMPEKDGFTLVRELRRLPYEQGCDTPVIALTAYARPEDQAQAFESGCQAHLSKPVNPVDLVRTIHRLAIARPKLPATLGVRDEDLRPASAIQLPA